MQIAGVKINENKRVKYYYFDNLNLKKNLTVIVDTEVGLQFARVYSIIDKELDESQIEKGKIVRITTKKDYVRYLANLKDAKTALKKCRELVKKLKLNMYIIDAEYTFTRNQLIYHFIADDRVDFRQLAKDLGSFYKTRIELRQIGIRDKAKEIGGVGLCGRRLCCSLFLNEFDSVSINMAKNQSLSLNPSKINGACSRLLCCLKYENENYSKCRQNLPNVGSIIDNDKVKGKVVSVDVLNSKYKVLTDKNTIVEVSVDNADKE